MKRRRFFFLTAGLILMLSAALFGCGNSIDERRGVRIRELYAQDGTFLHNGTRTAYAYHVPQLAGEGDALREINARLTRDYGAIVTQAIADIEKGNEPKTRSVTYAAHWTGEVLSLVVECEDSDGALQAQAIHFDAENKETLTNAQLLTRLEIGQAELSEALACAAARTFDALHADDPVENAAELAARRAWVVSKENIDPQSAVFYPDGEGLTAYVPISQTHAARVPLSELKKEAGRAKTARCEFVEATLTQDGAVEVRFLRIGSAEAYRDMVGLSYDETYRAEHTYGDYVDIAVGSVGRDFRPIVFLTTRDGGVEWIDVFGGLQSGAFTGGGRLWGVKNAARMEPVFAGDGAGLWRTVYAEDADGARYDLGAALLMQCADMPRLFAGTWAREDGEAIAIGEDGELALTDAQGNAAAGRLEFLGMDDTGLIFAFSLEDGARGALALFEKDGALLVRAAAGENFFDTPRNVLSAFSSVS